jgi:hypothetical protein
MRERAGFSPTPWVPPVFEAGQQDYRADLEPRTAGSQASRLAEGLDLPRAFPKSGKMASIAG